MGSRDLWVLAEHSGGAWQEVTLELLGEAKRLAPLVRGKVIALLLGKEVSAVAADLAEYGADTVYVVEHPVLETYITEAYTSILHGLITREKPEVLLLGATSLGRDLASRLAARLKSGLVAECVALGVNSQGLLEMTRAAYGGSVYATRICPEARPQIVTVCPGVIGKEKPDKRRRAEVIELKVDIDPDSFQTQIAGVIPADPKTIDISEADVLVACGRGLGSKEKLTLIQELADALQAAVGGSRVAIDNGWLPAERQIGLTGKTVSAKLIIACGISGASQFMAGIKDCQFVIPVNTDRAAPIFKIADVGILADMHKFLPSLISQLGRRT
ncbi:MAG: electron transfer flavoprotein subunit alpha/FixB family protein [Chloroflexi bacterium]|nr:electron transfer flavoprotein subunit alpha/FixB family protein [Chloroflexota bacterium]